MKSWTYFALLFSCLLFLAGCPEQVPHPPEKPSGERPVLERVVAGEIPDPHDDHSADSLRAAIATSLGWYKRLPPEKTFSFGSSTITVAALTESLVHFLKLFETESVTAQVLARDFDVFRVVPPERSGKMLVTGYYEPVLRGSLKPDERFKWPLYAVPPDLITVDLERFKPEKYKGERIVGRLDKNRLMPFYTRAEIDGQRKLEKSRAQLLWLDDPVDCFFLHVQGSGVVRLPDGTMQRVGYAGANGRPYNSIGKTLIDRGVIPREEMSLQAIRNYLRSHPEVRDEIMWSNESYVFFRLVEDGPVGSLNAVVTGGRSVASDPKHHPRGALAFLISEKPRYDSSGQVAGWDRFSRWVLHQDTGGAIKGPGRIDLFCGTGDSAEAIAGPMKQPGEMYYFIKKGLVSEKQ